MAWTFSLDKPIYLQIVERIIADIINGKYVPDQKIPSVREFALEAGVNPNTIQKAMTELERTGFLYSKRGEGRFVDKSSNYDESKSQITMQKTKAYISDMLAMGLTKDNIIEIIDKHFEVNL